jgi:hypothetical protein
MTFDVDLFARPTAARRVEASLRAAGLTVEGLRSAHLIAYFPEDNRLWLDQGQPPEFRIDLLVTVTEPEATAIQTAQPAELAGIQAAFVRPDELTALKFLAGRPQDLADVEALLGTGRVSVERVRYLLSTTHGSAAALRFVALAHKAPRLGDSPRYLSRTQLRELFARRQRGTGDPPGRAP